METAAPTIRALELENQRLRAAQRESAEAILELQREACARDGVPMPSERPLVDKLRDENQRLRADVAELVEAFADLLGALDMEPDYNASFAEYDKAWVSAEVHARRLIAKHGA